MVRKVVVQALEQVDRGVEDPLDCVTSGPVDLYLNIEDYAALEKVLHKLFDEDSVKRIKAALKSKP